MLKIGVKFILELVSGASGTGTLRTTSLHHEVIDHPMKFQAIVKTFSGEFNKICHRFGCLVFK